MPPAFNVHLGCAHITYVCIPSRQATKSSDVSLIQSVCGGSAAEGAIYCDWSLSI
jgi:hypothetical protein